MIFWAFWRSPLVVQFSCDLSFQTENSGHRKTLGMIFISGNFYTTNAGFPSRRIQMNAPESTATARTNNRSSNRSNTRGDRRGNNHRTSNRRDREFTPRRFYVPFKELANSGVGPFRPEGAKEHQGCEIALVSPQKIVVTGKNDSEAVLWPGDTLRLAAGEVALVKGPRHFTDPVRKFIASRTTLGQALIHDVDTDVTYPSSCVNGSAPRILGEPDRVYYADEIQTAVRGAKAIITLDPKAKGRITGIFVRTAADRREVAEWLIGQFREIFGLTASKKAEEPAAEKTAVDLLPDQSVAETWEADRIDYYLVEINNRLAGGRATVEFDGEEYVFQAATNGDHNFLSIARKTSKGPVVIEFTEALRIGLLDFAADSIM